MDRYHEGVQDAGRGRCSVELNIITSKHGITLTLDDLALREFQYICGYMWRRGFRWLYFYSASFQGDSPGNDRFEAYAVFEDDKYGEDRIDFNSRIYDLTFDLVVDAAAKELGLAKWRAGIMDMVGADTPPSQYRWVMNALDDIEEASGDMAGAFTALFPRGNRFFVNYNGGLLLLDGPGGRPVALGPQALLLPW